MGALTEDWRGWVRVLVVLEVVVLEVVVLEVVVVGFGGTETRAGRLRLVVDAAAAAAGILGMDSGSRVRPSRQGH